MFLHFKKSNISIILTQSSQLFSWYSTLSSTLLEQTVTNRCERRFWKKRLSIGINRIAGQLRRLLVMSEKLRRCRQGLSAALDRALEGSAAAQGCLLVACALERQAPQPSVAPTPRLLAFSGEAPDCVLRPGAVHCFLPASPEHRDSLCSSNLPLLCGAVSPTLLSLSSPVFPGEEAFICGKLDCSFSSSSDLPLAQDLLEDFEDIQALEDLAGKLEFENTLNRVYCNMSQGAELDNLTMLCGDELKSSLEGSSKENTSETEEHNMIEAALEMEQEYDLLFYCNRFFS
ncbi:uncharacterized protein C3orf62 homolog isoform X2 [Lepisosteus oculatus]|uniref:uncharacterized protein C3orf62 homolog isoform X2 n=1 Tax=Lepisosteus oculatus TaxID=7918 RepID=UPI003713D6C8